MQNVSLKETIITNIANFLCVFSILLESVKERLFHTTDAYSSFDLIKELYKTTRQYKEEKLYVT
jgi:hypothetical protein